MSKELKNLSVLAGAIPASSLLLSSLVVGQTYSVEGVSCFIDSSITEISQITDKETARASSVVLMNESSSERNFINLGSFLGTQLESGDGNVFSSMASQDKPKFISKITIASVEDTIKDGLVVYPYKSIKAYPALLADATIALADAITKKSVKEDDYKDGRNYLFNSGNFVAELAKLRKSTAKQRIDGAKPYQTMTVSVE